MILYNFTLSLPKYKILNTVKCISGPNEANYPNNPELHCKN